MIINSQGHGFKDDSHKILVPVGGKVKRSTKPRIRCTPGMKMREFYKIKENGDTLAYTPKAVQKHNNQCFHLGIYQSPTGIFLPKGKKDDQ